MPYAIRKVREEIVTEEMLEEATERFRKADDRYGVSMTQLAKARMEWAEAKLLTMIADQKRQQRELADGTLVLEPEATDV